MANKYIFINAPVDKESMKKFTKELEKVLTSMFVRELNKCAIKAENTND